MGNEAVRPLSSHVYHIDLAVGVVTSAGVGELSTAGQIAVPVGGPRR